MSDAEMIDLMVDSMKWTRVAFIAHSVLWAILAVMVVVLFYKSGL